MKLTTGYKKPIDSDSNVLLAGGGNKTIQQIINDFGVMSIAPAITFTQPINADILGNATTADRLKNDVSGTEGTGWQPVKIENGVIKYYNTNTTYSALPANGGTSEYANNLNIYDTRSTNTSTSGSRLITAHFKSNSSDGLSDGGSYHLNLNMQQWGDSSGGSTYNLGFTVNGNMWLRSASIGGTWGNWKRLAFANDLPAPLTTSEFNTILGSLT